MTVTTPGTGSSITSTTTVSTSRLGDFALCCFFREVPFTARLGLALLPLRFVPPLRPDFEALRALARAAEVLLRSFARLLGCAFARFFRLAMISSQPLCTAVA